PRLVVDPGPPPRVLPHPAPGAVRSPVRRHAARPPHVAVVVAVLPVTVVVEVLGTVDPVAHVAVAVRVLDARRALLLPVVARLACAVQAVRAGPRLFAGSRYADAVPRADIVVRIRDVNRRVAVANLYVRLAAAIDLDAVNAGAASDDRGSRGIELDVVT